MERLLDFDITEVRVEGADVYMPRAVDLPSADADDGLFGMGPYLPASLSGLSLTGAIGTETALRGIFRSRELAIGGLRLAGFHGLWDYEAGHLRIPEASASVHRSARTGFRGLTPDEDAAPAERITATVDTTATSWSMEVVFEGADGRLPSWLGAGPSTWHGQDTVQHEARISFRLVAIGPLLMPDLLTGDGWVEMTEGSISGTFLASYARSLLALPRDADLEIEKFRGDMQLRPGGLLEIKPGWINTSIGSVCVAGVQHLWNSRVEMRLFVRIPRTLGMWADSLPGAVLDLLTDSTGNVRLPMTISGYVWSPRLERQLPPTLLSALRGYDRELFERQLNEMNPCQNAAS